MTTATRPLTERQHELVMTAYCETDGLIEPLLSITGGAKLRMISSLEQRGMIEQIDGQWCISERARCLLEGREYDPEAQAAPEPEEAVDANTEDEIEALQQESQAEAEAQPEEAVQSEPVPETKPTELQVVALPEVDEATRQAQAEALQNLRPGSKQAKVLEMLRQPGGTTIDDIMAATGWQAHTVRGTFSATFKRRLGVNIISEKVELNGSRQRRYRVEASHQASG